MESPGLQDRFSRQTILPGVGAEGQAKWESASVLLAGEGPALDAAKTALNRTGLTRITILDPSNHPLPISHSMVITVTGDSEWRRRLSRHCRSRSQAALFAWHCGSGFAIFLTGPDKGCPCLECFEVSNPKAFSGSAMKITKNVEFPADRMMGAMAATEALQWILKGESALEGKVWMTSFDDGLSLRHEVHPSSKCPAALAEDGTAATP